ncbi:MAG TPA: VanZ family protein [Thermoanaerobaculia bacterium]|nr:VanZ family protein [Thermoanaerobaculia bacterium]
MSPRPARIALALYLLAIYATLGVVRTATNTLRDAGILRVSVAVAFVLAAATALWLIFRNPRNRTRRVVGVLAGVAAAYALVILPMKSPEEKIHFIQYGVVALLAYASIPDIRRRYLSAAVFVAAAGWIDEGIQALLPSRYYDLRDVAFNAAAGLMALAALALCSPRERIVGTDRPEEVAFDADHRGASGERP